MGSDSPLDVRLEVTIPRIVLPQLHTPHHPQASSEQLDRASTGQERVRGKDEEEEGEQVRLLAQELTQFRVQHPVIEATSRLIHTLHFRLLRVTMPVQGRVFGLQILRWRNWFNHHQVTRTSDRENGDHLFVTDELTFSLEFLHPQELSPAVTSAPVTPFTPGLNQVVIFLDHDGIPVSYSIDGAES